MAEHRDRRPGEVRVGLDELDALGQERVGVHWQHADELLAVKPKEVRSHVRSPTDEVLLLRHDPVHAQVLRCDGPVGLLADDRVTLLSSEHVQCLCAIRGDAVRRAGRHDCLPEPQAVPGGHIQLVRQLAGERDAKRAPGRTGDDRIAPGHEREGSRADVKTGGEGRDDIARAWTDDRHRRPLLRHRGGPDPKLRPLCLEPLLEVIEDRGGVAGGRGHVESVRAEAARDPVIEDHPIQPAHEPITARPDLEGRERVRVDAIEQEARVGSLEVDLAEGGRIHDGDGGSRGDALAPDGRFHVLAVTREVARPAPLADILEDGAAGRVPGLDRGGADGVAEGASVTAGHERETDRHVRWAERRHTHRTHVLPEHRRGDGRCDDAGGLALVRRGSDRRVALEVLDGGQAGVEGASQVGGGGVALEVDVVVGPRVRSVRVQWRDDPQRCDVG